MRRGTTVGETRLHWPLLHWPARVTTSGPRVKPPAFRWIVRALRPMAWLGCIGLVGWAAGVEANSAKLQSSLLSRWASKMTFTVAPVGQSPKGQNTASVQGGLVLAQSGPYDARFGYAAAPSFLALLEHAGYAVERRAVPSRELAAFVGHGGYPPYHEKDQAGLTLYDRSGVLLHSGKYPPFIYRNFEEIPPLVVNTLLFAEDRHLLDPTPAERNPAVDWPRFARAAAGQIAGVVVPHLRSGGGSTLATQIEKFRHSPEGRTERIGEKLRQMMNAAVLAYKDGPETLATRRRIVVTYLNSTPLASRPGYGEIIGLGEALQLWFGTDFTDANRILRSPARTPAELARKGAIYRQVLSLLIAERRPNYYLITNPDALAAQTDRYLEKLAAAGIIDAKLKDAALKASLPPLPPIPAFADEIPEGNPPGESKLSETLRADLLNLLKVPNFYALDRLDLTVHSSIDWATQQRVQAILDQLNDPEFVDTHHLVGHYLLHTDRNLHVNYSVVIYERGADGNYVRVHADSLNEPFDINSGAKLILGSTAKLRTLVTYLNIVTELHGRLAGLPKAELTALAKEAHDPLTEWAATWLASSQEKDLPAMLDAAMQRRYSASPGEFFTDGGTHFFHNFERWENTLRPTVEEAFENSINLVFIRLMRNIRQYFMAQNAEAQRILSDPTDSAREAYLHRFVEEEGQKFINRFYHRYRGLERAAILAQISRRGRAGLDRHVALFRAVVPKASFADLKAFLTAQRFAHVSDPDLLELYEKYDPARFSLADRAYIAGVHPLEVWVASYLVEHPAASRAEVWEQSKTALPESYGWLLKTHHKHKQDVRLRILLEEDAFEQILKDWQRQGYPFGHLVPTLADVIGSSGDRPDALAVLMGIILNDGVRKPTAEFEHFEFAQGTPFEAEIGFHPQSAERVMAPEVAARIRQALRGVVANGTAKGLQGAYLGPDGKPLEIGGKTGTGDNRFDTFAPGGAILSSRPVDRTATFVFFLGDRFFGTVTAYVSGPEAGRYNFTSALAVQVLKLLEPALAPLIGSRLGNVQAGL